MCAIAPKWRTACSFEHLGRDVEDASCTRSSVCAENWAIAVRQAAVGCCGTNSRCQCPVTPVVERVAGRRSPGSAWRREAISATRSPSRTIGRIFNGGKRERRSWRVIISPDAIEVHAVAGSARPAPSRARRPAMTGWGLVSGMLPAGMPDPGAGRRGPGQVPRSLHGGSRPADRTGGTLPGTDPGRPGV